jgi:putative transposase
MKRKRHTEEQIIALLKEHEAGVKTADLCRKPGISEATFYQLGRPISEGLRSPTPGGRTVGARERHAEEALGGLYAEHAALKDLLSKNGGALRQARGRPASAYHV